MPKRKTTFSQLELLVHGIAHFKNETYQEVRNANQNHKAHSFPEKHNKNCLICFLQFGACPVSCNCHEIFSNLDRHTFEKVRWRRTQTLWHQYLKFIIGHMQMIGSTNDRMRSKLDCLPTPGAHSTHSLLLYSRLHSLFPCDACTSARQYAAKISIQAV